MFQTINESLHYRNIFISKFYLHLLQIQVTNFCKEKLFCKKDLFQDLKLYFCTLQIGFLSKWILILTHYRQFSLKIKHKTIQELLKYVNYLNNSSMKYPESNNPFYDLLKGEVKCSKWKSSKTTLCKDLCSSLLT